LVTFNRHPFVMTHLAEERRSELQAEVDRYRLARDAQGTATPRQQCRELPAVLAIVVALALLLVAGSAMGLHVTGL
jgi:hypothetical protein